MDTLKRLEGENARLKKLFADSMLDNATLKDRHPKILDSAFDRQNAEKHLATMPTWVKLATYQSALVNCC
jgi:hypothetical protein